VTAIDPWWLEHLVCPVDHQRLSLTGGDLACGAGHRYPVADGTPVMLVPDAAPTIGVETASLQRAAGAAIDQRAPGLYLESLGISAEEKAEVVELADRGGTIDPVVALLVAATNGLMYRHLLGTLDRYPIPDLPLPPGRGRRLLDVGCSWGRWSLAASARGYDAIGVDPSLGAVKAAERVARQLGASSRYVVADGRHLPFADSAFDTVFSYSVVQHLSHADAEQCAAEIGRVLRCGGTMKVQMPAQYGIRCLYHQARRGFRAARGFEVRYRTLPELRRLFGPRVGRVEFEADCFFGIGLQPSDADLMTGSRRAILAASSALTRASRTITPLIWVADSVFVEAVKATPPNR
jgi:SAM-dependent methyltransferase